MDIVELSSLRSLVYVGNHERAAEEYDSLKGTLTDARGQTLREVYQSRALVERGGQHREKALAAISPQSAAALQAVRLLADVQRAAADADDDAKAAALATLSEWLSDETIASDQAFILVAAHVLYEAGDVAQALRLVHNGESLEHMALKVQCLLKIARADLAEDVVKAMKDEDDDDALTGLAMAALAAALGGADRLKEAMETLQELTDKFGQTVKLLNAQAACHMQLGNYTDAFQLLRQARDLAKSEGDKTHPDTLVNTMACVRLMQKAAAVPKIMAELQQGHPAHPWLAQQEELSATLDRCAATYALKQ